MTRAAAIAALAIVVGCVPSLTVRFRSRLEVPGGAFVFEYSEQDRGEVARVEASVAKAMPVLSRWGRLREPVRVFILPTHEALEEAVDRRGYGWLRAWARYDEVFLQSPRTWGFFPATQRELDELLLHELTHCLMYQLAATRTSWTRKEIPLWFREGMASFTADQGHRWPPLDELARFYDESPGLDPVGAPDGLYQLESAIVYGAAHHAFTFLIRRYGEDRVASLLRAMSGGASFPDAFEDVYGISVARFVEDFRRYVRLRGFKLGRVTAGAPPRVKPPRPPSPPPPGQPEAPAPERALPPPPARGCRLP